MISSCIIVKRSFDHLARWWRGVKLLCGSRLSAEKAALAIQELRTPPPASYRSLSGPSGPKYPWRGKSGVFDGVFNGVSLGPFGPQAPECPESVPGVSKRCPGHSGDTLGTLLETRDYLGICLVRHCSFTSSPLKIDASGRSPRKAVDCADRIMVLLAPKSVKLVGMRYSPQIARPCRSL